MAKTHNNLYQQLLSYSLLESAFYTAAHGKANKKIVSDFRNNLPVELLQLLRELQDKTYTPRPYKTFEVYEPKKRTIHAPHFRDVVVQRAIHSIIEPLFEATFIHDSYGCRTFKGTHRASDTVQRMMRNSDPDSYYLQLDIAKYFYNIDRTVLIELLKKKISDTELINLITLFIPHQTGIPIGNLLSQLFSNIYMNVVDQHCKRELKIKNYVRYVDDFVIIGHSRTEIHDFIKSIESLLADIKLRLSRFTVQKISRGINYCGYRTWRRTKFVRKRSLHKFKSTLNKNNYRAIQSCLGHAVPTANYRNFKLLCQQYINTHQQ